MFNHSWVFAITSLCDIIKHQYYMPLSIIIMQQLKKQNIPKIYIYIYKPNIQPSQRPYLTYTTNNLVNKHRRIYLYHKHLYKTLYNP